MNVTKAIIDWLLEPSNPSVRYRTLTELLGLPANDPDVIETKTQISDYPVVTKILSLIKEDGDWPWSDGYDSPELGFAYLGETGIDKSHDLVNKAVNVFLTRQSDDGRFPNSYFMQRRNKIILDDQSCYYSMMLRGFIKLGYREDPRIQKAIDFTLSQSRWDGGYLCTKSYVKGGTKTKSCIRGSKGVLMLFAELPELWDTPVCKDLLTYFLERKVFYKRHNFNEFVREKPQAIFPFHYRFGLLDTLYALSKMGYGNHPDMADAWVFLEEKREDTGKYNLDWTMPKCAFNAGKRGEPNKWITLYAYLCLKQKTHKKSTI